MDAKKKDGWIEYHGEGQPVADDVLVDIRFRDGAETK